MDEERECFVYVIGFDPDKAPSKVGIANDPVKRMASLQTAHHQKLCLVGSWSTPCRDIARVLENSFHVVQAKDRLNGEWFNLSPKACMAILHIGLGVALDAHTDFTGPEIDEILKRSRHEYV